MADLKRSAVFELHGAMDAKMAPVAGWTMPLQYPGGTAAEVLHTRKHVSISDCSHYGKFRTAGSGTAAALDKKLFYGTSDLPLQGCRNDLLLDDGGRIITDLTVCRMAQEDFFLLTNPAGTAAAATALQHLLPPDALCGDLTQELAIFDLLGPEAEEVTNFLDIPAGSLPEKGRLQVVPIDGVNIILCRSTASAGADGYRFCFRRDHAVDLWEMILEYPKVDPAGFNAADVLRLESAYPVSARESVPEATPAELGFTTSRSTDAPAISFLTRPAILEGRRAAPAGTPVRNAGDGTLIGEVLAGAFSPTLGCAIALCRINGTEPLPENTPILLGREEQKMAAKIIDGRFIEEI